MQITDRRTADLKPHPQNEKIYGNGQVPEDAVESIRKLGILEPIRINAEDVIISGHQRWRAACELAWEFVPTLPCHASDELEEIRELIHSNMQRERTNVIKMREVQALEPVEKELAKRRQGTRNDIVKRVTPSKTRDAVGEQVGVSGPTVEKLKYVADTIDELRENHNTSAADYLEEQVNLSIAKAHSLAKTEKRRAQTPVGKQLVMEGKPQREWPLVVTLDEWGKLPTERRDILLKVPPSGGFNRQGEEGEKPRHRCDKHSAVALVCPECADASGNIEWAKWSWNPVTGCKHNCPYCYARDIAERFYTQGFVPSLVPHKLWVPRTVKPGAGAEQNVGYKNVFVCSMADLFGKWVPAEWINAVLESCRMAPDWNFLFLTKFPGRLAEFEFPDNAWVGTTVDCQARVAAAEKAFRNVRAKFKWLSCEPLIEPLKFSSLDMFDWIVIGGASKSTQTPDYIPPTKWIADLFTEASAHGLGVYLKTNGRPREYPGSKPGTAPEEMRYLPGK